MDAKWFAQAIAGTFLAFSCLTPMQGLAQQGAEVTILEGGRVVVSNHGPIQDRSEAGWELVEELRLGRFQGSGPDVLGDVGHITVDERGRIYILDIGSREVRVFDRDGRHLRNMVRDGDGPGEINYRRYGPDVGADHMRVLWQPPNRLWVETAHQESVTVDSLGNHLRRTPWRFPYFPEGTRATESSLVDADTLGAIYEELQVDEWLDYSIREFPRMSYIVRLAVSADHELLAEDTLLVETRRVEMGLPELAGGAGGQIEIEKPVRQDAQQMVWAIGRGGELWLANRASYRFHRVTLEGDTLRTVELGTPRILPSGPVDALEYEPVIAGLRVSPEGWLWVARERQDSGDEDRGPVWDLFDNCGEYRGAAFAPLPLTVPHIGPAGAVHGVISNAFDLDYVLRLRLEGTDGSAVVAEACHH